MKQNNQAASWIKRCTSAVLLASALVAPAVMAESGVATVHDKINVGSVVEQSAQVNVNTADVEQLASKLKGIGKVKAEAIIAYRTEFGPFANPKDLMKVKGIGKSTLKNIEGQLSF